MRHLLLIRHAQTRPVAGVRPADFTLTGEGRRRCKSFAQELAPWNPTVIVTSEEAKARETGEIIGRALGLQVESFPGLEEHHREAFESLGSQVEFQKSVERVFAKLDQVVYGKESGTDALKRFSAAVEEVLAAHPSGNIAVVTHGTVMALFTAAYNAIDVKAFWRGLAMPDLVVIRVPGFRIHL